MSPSDQVNDDTALSKNRLRLWLKLLKASRLIEDEIRRRLRSDYQLTLPRFDVMTTLSQSPDGLKMSEISKQLRVSNGNVTGIVDRLADEGLAVRSAVKGDRRAYLVRLTPEGRRVFDAHATAHEGWIDEMLSGFNEDDVQGMIVRLEHLTQTLDKES
ncbi:MAG: MarR family transcriptional regulator [Paracoccaceae bacterium]